MGETKKVGRWQARRGGGLLAAALLALSAAPDAHAVQPDEILADKHLEERARAISAGLRCLVCQNQSIDDSDAPLARDLRLLVRERLTAGDSDADVEKFIVARYGEFVLLKPPLTSQTLILWVAPGLVMLAAGFIAWRSMGSPGANGRANAPQRLTPEEQAQLELVLRNRDVNE